MERQEHLAMASIPVQQWGELYEQARALSIGTIFRDLDKPFFASEEEFGNIPRSCPSQRPGDPGQFEEAMNAPEDCGCGGQKEGQSESGGCAEQTQNASQQQQGRECMMLQVMEIGFLLDDIRLYMDTHQQDENGLQFLKQTVQRRRQLLQEFAGRYYPLTMDYMAQLYEENPESKCYCWEKGPMPWEGACV